MPEPREVRFRPEKLIDVQMLIGQRVSWEGLPYTVTDINRSSLAVRLYPAGPGDVRKRLEDVL